MNITAQQIVDLCPEVTLLSAEKHAPTIAAAMQEFGIDDVDFVKAIAAASNNFLKLTETFNYSATELQKQFPKKFADNTIATLYEYKQEKIAIRIYSGKDGNSNEPRSDGWTYRGRGFFKICCRNNYYYCGRALNLDLLANPAYLSTPAGAARSSAWLWKTKGETK